MSSWRQPAVIEYGTVIVPPKGITDDEVVQPLKAVIRVATTGG